MATAKKSSARKSAAKTTATPDIAPEQTNATPDSSAESLPVGAVIEHEGLNRWRVRVIGQPRYGHGKTHAEAVADYLAEPT